MKYIVAISIVCVIFGFALRFIMETRREVRDALREALKLPEVQAQFSEEEKQSMSQGNLEGLGTELPASLIVRIQCCDLLKKFWFVWIPLTLGLGLAIVSLWTATRTNRAVDRSPADATSTATKPDS